MRLMIGNSRSAAIPWTYCGVTAVSSMTTPAALAVARPVAAASRARTATSSRSPKRPALIASPLPSRLADGQPKGKSHWLIVGSEESVDHRKLASPVLGSYVVVERELVWGHPKVERRKLVVALVVDPRLDQVRREHASLGEVFAVFLQTVDHRGQLGRSLNDFRGLFWRQL